MTPTPDLADRPIAAKPMTHYGRQWLHELAAQPIDGDVAMFSTFEEMDLDMRHRNWAMSPTERTLIAEILRRSAWGGIDISQYEIQDSPAQGCPSFSGATISDLRNESI